MIVVNTYPLCLTAEESIDYLLLNCESAREIWNSILSSFEGSWVLPKHIYDLFDA